MPSLRQHITIKEWNAHTVWSFTTLYAHFQKRNSLSPFCAFFLLVWKGLLQTASMLSFVLISSDCHLTIILCTVIWLWLTVEELSIKDQHNKLKLLLGIYMYSLLPNNQAVLFWMTRVTCTSVSVSESRHWRWVKPVTWFPVYRKWEEGTRLYRSRSTRTGTSQSGETI